MVAELQQQAHTSRHVEELELMKQQAYNDLALERLERRRLKRLRKQEMIKSKTFMYLNEKEKVNVPQRRNTRGPISIHDYKKRSKSNESNVLFLPY